eukprot:9313929-Alexandrium_andersonii.AAC.1
MGKRARGLSAVDLVAPLRRTCCSASTRPLAALPALYTGVLALPVAAQLLPGRAADRAVAVRAEEQLAVKLGGLAGSSLVPFRRGAVVYGGLSLIHI